MVPGVCNYIVDFVNNWWFQPKRINFMRKKIEMYFNQSLLIFILGESLGIGLEVYPCRKCNRIYARKYTRSRHERLECGIAAQFECPFCNFRAKHKHNLKSHISKAHR